MYPDSHVIEFMNKNMIPLKVEFGCQPLSSDFKVKWTPALLILDWDGEEHHRTVGFLSPEELVASLMLGMAKAYFGRDIFDRALPMLAKLLEQYPHSHAAPEALYLRGVSSYKSTHNPMPLRETYEQLRRDYPDSEWTKRAEPYRLIEAP